TTHVIRDVVNEDRKLATPLIRPVRNELEARRSDFSLVGILYQPNALKLLCTRFYALRNVFAYIPPYPLRI
ncbi:hypothetical protein Q2T74_29430, partial [Klebsiella variicola]|uniref:hypothetical protein n=1 Tax=Klebsiella variicola TaxID=244366 RepID=UPI00265E7490